MIAFEAWCNCEGTGVMPVPDADMYVICVFCDGVGTITIKGEKMEEQEDKQFAYEEYVELKKNYQETRDKFWEQRGEIIKIRDTVRNWFQELYEASYYSDDFNVEIGDVNTLLIDIKASPLSKLFEATATIELSIKVQADDTDDADTIIRDHIESIDWNMYGDDNNEIEVDSIYVNVSE